MVVVTIKRLALGLMRLPLLDENDDASVDLNHVTEMVDLFLEKGFSYFDTSYIYHDGNSETIFRKTVVERYPRILCYC